MSNFFDLDPRILDFRKDELVLPDNFLSTSEKNMVLACGDGDDRGIDLQVYRSRFDRDYNIFCCKYDYNPLGLEKNIRYLIEHPELNIILCLFDFENPYHLEKLVNLFENSINAISTDDMRHYIPMIYAYKLLVNHGFLFDVNIRTNRYKSLGYNRNDEVFNELFEQVGTNVNRFFLKTNKRADLNNINKQLRNKYKKQLDEQAGGYYLKYLKYKKKYLTK